MIFNEIQSVPMKAKDPVQRWGILAHRITSTGYTWTSDFTDFQRHPDFPLQLLMEVEDYGWLTPQDITTYLNLAPKNNEDTPKDMALGFKDDGFRRLGFSVMHSLHGKEHKQYTGLIEWENGEVRSKELRFNPEMQNGMRERLDRTLGEKFPYAEATYELLRKSAPVGYEKQFDKYRGAALKRFERYVLK